MIRRPPTSTLFPTRRSSDLLDRPGGYLFPETPAPPEGRKPIHLYRAEKNRFWPRVGVAYTRSEEHTSELQSRGHLVCRLLLEKKKKKNNKTTNRHNNNHTHV